MNFQPSLFDQTEVFYNTLGLKSTELKQAEQDTAAQDARVHEVFKSGDAMTPWEAHDRLNDEIFIVDVRRAINTLTKQGILVNTGEQKMERKGKPNFIWTLKTKME